MNIINIADGPRATARMSNLAFCALARGRTGVEPILHVCCRDRSYLGLVAHLLGAHALGLRDVVIITGDPPKMGDYPFSTRSTTSIRSACSRSRPASTTASIPRGAGSPDGPTSFVLATGAEPGAVDYDRELRRIELKRDAGAELISDPAGLQSGDAGQRFLRRRRAARPARDGGAASRWRPHRNAEFLHNNIPGMQIPSEIRERMRKTPGGEAARKEGVKIAREMLYSVRARVQGAYLMPPLGRYELALEVLEGLKG